MGSEGKASGSVFEVTQLVKAGRSGARISVLFTFPFVSCCLCLLPVKVGKSSVLVHRVLEAGEAPGNHEPQNHEPKKLFSAASSHC